MKYHHCSDKCKGRQNCMSECYNCCEKFYVKCFGVDHQFLPRLNSSESCIRFVCGNCLLKSKRQSISTPAIVSTPPITIASTPVSGAPVSGAAHRDILIDKIDSLINLMERHTKSIDSQNESEIKPVNTILNDDVSSRSINSTTLDNIYKIILKSSDKIDKLHSIENENSSMQKIMNFIDKKITVPLANKNGYFDNTDMTNKVHNWSVIEDSVNKSITEFAGRPSLLIKQSIDDDILDILKRSEATTWGTLDILLKKANEFSFKLDEHNLKIDEQNIQIMEFLRNFDDHNKPAVNAGEPYNLRSALFETINPTLSDSLNSSYMTHQLAVLSDVTSESPTSNSSSNVDENTDKINEFISFNGNLGTVPESLNKTMRKGQTPSSSVPKPVIEVDLEALVIKAMENIEVSTIESSLNPPIIDSTIESSLNPPLNPVQSPVNTSQLNVHKLEFHLSRLAPSTTTNMVFDYMKNRGILDLSSVRISRLVARNRDLSSLTFVSFKIDTNHEIASVISHSDFWPPHCTLKTFVHKSCATASISNDPANTQSNHFLMERMETKSILI